MYRSGEAMLAQASWGARIMVATLARPVGDVVAFVERCLTRHARRAIDQQGHTIVEDDLSGAVNAVGMVGQLRMGFLHDKLYGGDDIGVSHWGRTGCLGIMFHAGAIATHFRCQ